MGAETALPLTGLVLTRLVQPIDLSIVLAVLAGAAFLLRRRRAGSLLLAGAVAWIWLWSLPVVADAVRLSLEGQVPDRPVAEYPAAGAIVVLGGAVAPAVPEGFPYPDLNNASARVWQASLLYHAGKAPRVVACADGSGPAAERASEAKALRRLLVALGIPGQSIALESGGGNLHETARALRSLLKRLGVRRVLLVASALRTPRAMETFRAAGIDAVAAPAGAARRMGGHRAADWLPDARALADSSRALDEYARLVVYRWRGWAMPGPGRAVRAPAAPGGRRAAPRTPGAPARVRLRAGSRTAARLS